MSNVATKTPYQRLLHVGFAPTGKHHQGKPILQKGDCKIIFCNHCGWIKTAAGALIRFSSPAFQNFLERKKEVAK